MMPSKRKAWTRGQKLGSGLYSEVWLGTNEENKKKFAVKSADKSNLEKRLALEVERKILKECKSDYIVRYLGCDMTDKVKEMKNLNTFNLFIEWVPRGSVLDQIDRAGGALNEFLVAAYTRDCLKALDFLHTKGIVHGDIKARNLLIGKNNLKLCDLGSGKFLRDGDLPLTPRKGQHLERRIFVTGTPGWKAPEVQDETEQGPESDIYSLGCTVVEMCTGSPPAKNPIIYSSSDIDPTTGFPVCTIDIPPSYSAQSREFVDLCLAEHSEDRPSAAELLKHPWIVNAPPYPVDKPRPRPPLKTQPLPPPPPLPSRGICLPKCGSLFGCKEI